MTPSYRHRAAIAAFLAAAASGVGCTSDPTDPAFTPPEDPLGVVQIAPGAALKIGFWGVLSGPDAGLGVDARRGVEIAIDDRSGELLGRTINLVSQDAHCTPQGGTAAASNFAADASVVALIGSVCSAEAVGGVPVVSAAGLTTISAVNTNPTFTDPAFRGPGGSLAESFAGYFRTAHSDAVQGMVAAQFAYHELGVRKAATIHDGSSYPEALQEVFAETFRDLGGTITSQRAVSAAQEDMTGLLTEIAAEEPELIYLPVYIAAGSHIAAQAPGVSGLEEVKLLGADAMFSPDFVTAAGLAAEGVFLSAPDASAYTGPYDSFLSKYRAKYGEPVSSFHAHGYDAANILFEAIERAAVSGPDGTLYIGRQALRDEMFATSGHPGVLGTLSCNPYGDCSLPVIAIFEITATEVGGEWPPSPPVWRP